MTGERPVVGAAGEDAGASSSALAPRRLFSDLSALPEIGAPSRLDIVLGGPPEPARPHGAPHLVVGDESPALGRAVLLLAEGRTQDVLLAASEACHQRPDLPQPHYVYGQAWLRLGEFANAERAFAEALRIAPDWADAWVNYGVARFHRDALDDAATAMRQALHHAPGNGAARANLAAFLALKREREAPVRVLEDADPARAFGLGVEYLMRKPAFARQPFGEWGDIMYSMVVRGHFRLFAAGSDRVVGFFGWALTTEEAATAWVKGQRKLRSEDCLVGNCVVFNAWAAEGPAIHRFMVGESRRLFADKGAGFYKRFYPDGRVRLARLPGNAFVERHVRRAAERLGGASADRVPET